MQNYNRYKFYLYANSVLCTLIFVICFINLYCSMSRTLLLRKHSVFWTFIKMSSQDTKITQVPASVTALWFAAQFLKKIKLRKKKFLRTWSSDLYIWLIDHFVPFNFSDGNNEFFHSLTTHHTWCKVRGVFQDDSMIFFIMARYLPKKELFL